MAHTVRRFLREHAMPAVACAAALASCALVPPDAGYAGYIDWGTLARLAAMLAVVAALREAGVFQAAAHALVMRCASTRALVAVLVAVTGAASMLVTNDMALLALLPLAAASLLDAGRPGLIAPAFVLQGLAANLCGMLLPFGNPQNIFLSAFYAVGLSDFVATMLPPFALSCALIAFATAVLTRGEREGRGGAMGETSVQESARRGSAELREIDQGGAGRRFVPSPDVAAEGHGAVAVSAVTTALDPARLCVLAILLGVCVLAVLGVLPAVLALLAVLVALFALDRGPACLSRVDWGLLVTFAAFFVFSGNLARIDAVRDAFAAWTAGGAFVPGALLSQVISNVPAAVVLARFTGDWEGLLAGVNVGGAGTPVGSLATLIVIAQFQALAHGLPEARRADLAGRRFWGLLVGLNLAFLVALLACGVVLRW